MKKLIPIVLITTLGLSSLAMAQPMPQGGFNDGSPHPEHHMMGGFNGGLVTATTVESTKNLPDESWVVLRGNIIKQVGKKDYIFKDATGEILIEVGPKAWKGQSISPKDLVEIAGEVNKDWDKIEIEVKQVKLIPPAPPAPKAQ